MLKRTKTVMGFLGMGIMILSLVIPAGVCAEAPAKIKVGLMFGLTGAASPIGPVQLEGAKLAIKEVNAAGGVKMGGKKVPVEFVVKDDETKPDIAIRRFRELTSEDKVDIIVGQTFAPISAAINKEVKKTPIGYFPVNVVAITMFEIGGTVPGETQLWIDNEKLTDAITVPGLSPNFPQVFCTPPDKDNQRRREHGRGEHRPDVGGIRVVRVHVRKTKTDCPPIAPGRTAGLRLLPALPDDEKAIPSVAVHQ